MKSADAMAVFEQQRSTGGRLPEGWNSAKLPQVASINMGQSPPGSSYNEEQRGLPFFQGKADFGERYPTVRVWCTDPKKVAQAGDVLMSVRAPIGPTNVAADICSIGRGLAAISPLGGVPTDFVLYGLRLLEPELALRGTGSTFTAINKNDLHEIFFNVPPLAEQQRIVAQLERLLARVDAARERLAKLPALLKRFRQAVLAAACSGRLTAEWREQHPAAGTVVDLLDAVRAERKKDYETQCCIAKAMGAGQPKRPMNLGPVPWDLPQPLQLPEIPENWAWVSLGDVATHVQYGTSTKADRSSNNGVAVLRMGNIQVGEIDFSDLKYIRRDTEDVRTYRLSKGDILFNRTNSPELVGKTAVFDSDREAIFASYIIRLRPDERLVASAIVTNWMNSDWGRWWARTVRTDGVSQSNINSTKLVSMPLPLPPVAEQHEIVRRVDALFRLAAAIERRAATAKAHTDKLTQAILAKAFRGELVPTEAELARREGRPYESAVELLARIQAERPASPARRLQRRRRSEKPNVSSTTPRGAP